MKSLLRISHDMLLAWAALAYAAGIACLPSTFAAETFAEQLVLRPLPDGRVSLLFEFELGVDADRRLGERIGELFFRQRYTGQSWERQSWTLDGSPLLHSSARSYKTMSPSCTSRWLPGGGSRRVGMTRCRPRLEVRVPKYGHTFEAKMAPCGSSTVDQTA